MNANLIGFTHKHSTEWSNIDNSSSGASMESSCSSNIKPVVEMKEETDCVVYKADHKGHLQLVNVPYSLPVLYDSVDDNYKSACYTKLSVEKDTTNQLYSKRLEDNNAYEQRVGSDSNYCQIKEEPPDNIVDDSSRNSISDTYGCSMNDQWESSEMQISLQIESTGLLTNAEKKRLYRLRLKEENPAMWNMVKQRESARKRENRKKRQDVLEEMKRVMNLPDHQDYLEMMKQRYPDVWENLLDATQITNELIINECDGRKPSFKPAKAYKDVIAAQKKRLYRQRLKRDRPEVYEKQKARDAYSRSRLRNQSNRRPARRSDDNSDIQDNEICKKLPYLHNLNVKESTNQTRRFESSTSCDINREDNCSNPSSIDSPSHFSDSRKQSDVLWFWNDTPSREYDLSDTTYRNNNPSSTILSSEERLLKIKKERLQLRERKRRYKENQKGIDTRQKILSNEDGSETEILIQGSDPE